MELLTARLPGKIQTPWNESYAPPTTNSLVEI